MRRPSPWTSGPLWVVLLLPGCVLGAADSIDVIWEAGWFDDDNDHELRAKSLSTMGAVPLAPATPAHLHSNVELEALRAARRSSEVHPADARGPPRRIASVLIRYDPVELIIYFDIRPDATAIETLVVEHACPYLRAEEVPLPVPYTVWVLHRSGESKRFVPKPEPIARGLLSRCPAQ